jgi:Mg2+/Co2+ transporter CorB
LDDIHVGVLFAALALLIGCSAFFSGSETGLMTLNRYRLRHRAKAGDKSALRVSRLLERPDRLIGVILLGNNFVNILASSLATIIAIYFLGEAGIAVSTIAMTLVVLIFGEVAPKTLAALHPERVAYPASAVLMLLLKVLYPLVWVTNAIVSGLLRLFRVTVQISNQHNTLSAEELRTVVLEAGVMIPKRHQTMLLSILELEEITVQDIMIPRSEVAGLDLDADWASITAQLTGSPYARLVVYRDTIDQVVGFLHLRKALNLMTQKPDFNFADLEEQIREPYFIPDGDVLGLVTLEDILEEIVGEFTTDPAATGKLNLAPRADGGYVVNGRTSVRSVNRMLSWTLPTDGPRTLNGLIMEHLGAIPEPGAQLMLSGHPVEIIEIAGNRIKTVVIWPQEAEPAAETGRN